RLPRRGPRQRRRRDRDVHIRRPCVGVLMAEVRKPETLEATVKDIVDRLRRVEAQASPAPSQSVGVELANQFPAATSAPVVPPAPAESKRTPLGPPPSRSVSSWPTSSPRSPAPRLSRPAIGACPPPIRRC